VVEGAGVTIRERNEAAEARARKDKHRALLHDGKIKVVSDTDPDVWYRVGAVGTGPGIIFECQPMRRSTGRPDHRHAHGRKMSMEPGLLTCRHAAHAAFRLEREGLAEKDDDGRWVTPAQLVLPEVADPFASFPAL
jgi:hypothetical protein